MNWEIKKDVLYINNGNKLIKYGIEYMQDWNEWEIYQAKKFRWLKPHFYSLDYILFNGRLRLCEIVQKSIFEALYNEKEIMVINKNTNDIYIDKDLKELLESRIIMEKLI